MTKLELIREVVSNYQNGISIERSLDAVARYSAAIVADSQCSTPLQFLDQMSSDILQWANANEGLIKEANMEDYERIIYVMRLIRERNVQWR